MGRGDREGERNRPGSWEGGGGVRGGGGEGGVRGGGGGVERWEGRVCRKGNICKI